MPTRCMEPMDTRLSLDLMQSWQKPVLPLTVARILRPRNYMPRKAAHMTKMRWEAQEKLSAQ